MAGCLLLWARQPTFSCHSPLFLVTRTSDSEVQTCLFVTRHLSLFLPCVWEIARTPEGSHGQRFSDRGPLNRNIAKLRLVMPATPAATRSSAARWLLSLLYLLCLLRVGLLQFLRLLLVLLLHLLRSFGTSLLFR